MMKKVFLCMVLVLSVASCVWAQETKFLQLSVLDPWQVIPAGDSIGGLRVGLFNTVNKDVNGVSITLFGVDRVDGDFSGIEFALINWGNGSAKGWQNGFINNTEKSFSGIQDGVVNVVDGDSSGLQLGLINNTQGTFNGWQAGGLNFTQGHFVGLQSGFINISKTQFSGIAIGGLNFAEGSAVGVQAGVINYAAQIKGIQFGVFNITKDLSGIQIGLANYKGNNRPLKFLPIINGTF